MPAAGWMSDQRDPVSVWFDPAARQLLVRAYGQPGQWAAQYLAPPSRRARAELFLMGVDPFEVDRWGEIRWVRAFKRSVYYQLRVHGYASGFRAAEERMSPWPGKSLEWQTGRRVTKPGWPAARWAIRVRLHPTGASAHRAALAIPGRSRWIDPRTGEATGLQSTVDDRPWLGR
jgi:hypothetical protein